MGYEKGFDCACSARSCMLYTWHRCPKLGTLQNYFELVTMNDPSNLLDKITIYPPVFGILQGGDTRLKIKICNNGNTLLKKSFFYVYYKDKKVGKTLLPSLKANGSYEFCVNVHDKIGRRDRQNVSFKIKRKKAFRTYRIAYPY